jgi:hypothetical protein
MTSILLTVISEVRVNIKVKEALKVITTEIIPKILREIHAETTEVSLRKEVIPKTFNNIALRDTRFIIDQGVGPRTTQKKSNKRIINDSKIDQRLDT